MKKKRLDEGNDEGGEGRPEGQEARPVQKANREVVNHRVVARLGRGRRCGAAGIFQAAAAPGSPNHMGTTAVSLCQHDAAEAVTAG